MPERVRFLRTAPWLSVRETWGLLFSRFEANYWDTHYTGIEELLLGLRNCFQATSNWVKCDDGWQQAYDLRVQAGQVCTIAIKTTAEDHGGMNRLFRVGLRLHRPWPFMSALLTISALIGYSLHTHFSHWLASTVLMVFIALFFLLCEVSRRGGQMVAVLREVSEQVKFHDCTVTPRKNAVPATDLRTEEMDTAFEEQ